jgi:actin-related protein
MFETFDVSNFYIALEAVMVLFSAGRTTGLAVESGHQATKVCSIFEGGNLTHASFKIDIAGKKIQDYLTKLMVNNGMTA